MPGAHYTERNEILVRRQKWSSLDRMNKSADLSMATFLQNKKN